MNNRKTIIGLAAIASLLLGLSCAGTDTSAPDDVAVVHRLIVDGVVSPVMSEFIVDSIDNAERAGAALVVIEINTPGGLDPSMREIIQRILASEVPVAVYVSPPGGRAASAGTFIAMSAHVAAMAPNTSIGAAHPVTIGMGGEGADEDMTAKITNDAVSYIRSLAKTRGRNEDWAERAVRKSASLHAEDALAEGVIEYVADDLEDLLGQMDGTEIKIDDRTVTLDFSEYVIEEIRPGLRQQFLAIITDPNIAYILLILGFYGLIFELSNPGAILPGIAGGICIILALYGLATLPVNYAGIALILFALLLFIAEVKVTSHGMLTIGGALSMLLGSIILIDTPVEYLRVSISVIIPAVVTTVLFFLLAVGLGIRAQRRKPTTGDRGMVGVRGRAETPVGPDGGRVFVHGEYWSATADEEVPQGAEVEVIEAKGLLIKIKQV
jgi:membrane-bound serine protease (ClpP class)